MKKSSQFIRVFVAAAVTLSMVFAPMPKAVAYAANEDNGVSLASVDTTSIEGVSVESEEAYFEKFGSDIPLAVKVSTERAMDISYQWYVGDEMIDGATDASYTVPKEDVEASNTYKYSCLITVTEGDFVDYIRRDFSIKIAGTLNCVYREDWYLVDEELTIPVLAVSSSDTLTYQWYKEVKDYYDEEAEEYRYFEEPIEGETGNTLTLKAKDLKANDSFDISCVVSDGNTTKRLYMQVEYYPIELEDVDRDFQIKPGESATLNVKAEAANQSELSYQWYKVKNEYNEEIDETVETLELIEGATESSYTVSSDQEDWLEFRCYVSTKTATISSGNYYVSVTENPYLELDYESWVEINKGEDAILSVKSNKTDVTYQWYKLNPELDEDEVDEYELDNYVPIEGETKDTCTISAADMLSDYSHFICVVTENAQDEYMEPTSREAYFTVEIMYDLYAYFTGEDDSDYSVVFAGENHMFTVRAGADENRGELKYQWMVNDEVVEGETEKYFSYTVPETGDYEIACRVSNDFEEKYVRVNLMIMNPKDALDISKDSSQEVSVDENKYQLLKFTPEKTGSYRIYATGSGDPWCKLYDSSYRLISYYDDADNLMFDFVDEFKAGETYYFLIGVFDSFNGQVNVSSKEEGSFAEDTFELYDSVKDVVFPITKGGTLTVETDKTEGLSYRWYVIEWDEDDNVTKYLIRDAKTDTLTIDPKDVGDKYMHYACTVSDGKTTKTAQFYVEFSSFGVEQSDYYDDVRQNQLVNMTVKAEGENLTYRWHEPVGYDYEDEEAVYREIQGENKASLSRNIQFFDGDDNIYYYCEVSDGLTTQYVWFNFYLIHEFDEWKVVKEATCTTTGLEERVCIDCGISEERTIEKIDHTVVVDPSVEATCTTKGLTEGSHCSVCGEVIKSQEEIPMKEHAWGSTYTTDVEASCTTEGTESIHCTNCSATKDSRPIPAAGHKFGDWKVVSASSCEEGGHRERVCSVCGVKEDEDFDPTGHTWDDDYTEDVKATCTTDGSKSIHCKNCSATKESEVIPATGHTEEIDPAVGATVFETGLTEGSHCSVCGEVLVPQEQLPKLAKTIKLSATKKTIKKKKSYTLKISGLAKGDSVKSVKTSKKSVATVKKVKTNQYKITGKKKGKSTITVTLKSGKTKTCKITVK